MANSSTYQSVRVPRALMDAARQKLNEPDVPESELVRRALAAFADRPADEFAVRMGRPVGVRENTPRAPKRRRAPKVAA